MLEKKQQVRESVSGSKVWYDYHFNTGKDVLNDFYHKYDLKLDMQKCLENQHQASTIIKSADKEIIICRYLHIENGVTTRGDCLNIILTPNNVITLRRSSDNLLSSLTDSFSSMTIDKMKPEAFVDIFLQKAYNSTLKVVTDVEAEISTLQENYEKNNILPLSKDLAHWQAVLGEATSIVAGHQQLINSLHAQIAKSGKEEDFNLSGLLDASCASMQMVLNSAIFTLDALNKALSQSLMERNTASIRTLTTICAVFLPIIFIAGVYSMRFENMPELKATWGFVFCIIVMAVVAFVSWWRNKQ
jgi:Mg2+ and Co2+ transporter CorA